MSMNVISSCKNCSDRHPACHDHCERYKEQVARNDALKEKKRQDYLERSIAVEHSIRQGKKAKKIEKQRRGY